MSDQEPDVPAFPVPDLDMDSLRIQPRLDFELTAEAAIPKAVSGSAASPGDALEEIADDMLDIVQRLGSLERQAQETASSLTALREAFAEHSSYQYKLVESVRRDLAGDRKGLALRAVFDPAAIALDHLEVILEGFDPEKDQAAYGQVSAAVATLANLLQSLGFTRCVPRLGEAFDPTLMQCLGYALGEPGIVLQVLRPGYVAGDTVVRPAGVLIADPEPKAPPITDPMTIEDTNA